MKQLRVFFSICIVLNTLANPASAFELKKQNFSALPQWQEDTHGEALEALQRSCQKIRSTDADVYGSGKLAFPRKDWLHLCKEAGLVSPQDKVGARAYFERNFIPFSIADGANTRTKFTGYYEPLLRGSRTKRTGYTAPVYARPKDLKNGQVYPLTRTDIENGALAGKGLERLWVSDPVDLFFLQVQGSGQVLLDTGETVALQFAGKTNQPYTSIGKVLVSRGEMSLEEASAPSIRHWLHTHPDQASEVMQQNKAYVFFDLSETVPESAFGAQNVPLFPERSLAVDQAMIPLGLPIYISTTLPQTRFSHGENYQRLLIAQDTGSAIRGPLRGDIFYGRGERAEELAGYMKSEGEWFLLLPKRTVQKWK